MAGERAATDFCNAPPVNDHIADDMPFSSTPAWITFGAVGPISPSGVVASTPLQDELPEPSHNGRNGRDTVYHRVASTRTYARPEPHARHAARMHYQPAPPDTGPAPTPKDRAPGRPSGER